MILGELYKSFGSYKASTLSQEFYALCNCMMSSLRAALCLCVCVGKCYSQFCVPLTVTESRLLSAADWLSGTVAITMAMNLRLVSYPREEVLWFRQLRSSVFVEVSIS